MTSHESRPDCQLLAYNATTSQSSLPRKKKKLEFAFVFDYCLILQLMKFVHIFMYRMCIIDMCIILTVKVVFFMLWGYVGCKDKCAI